MEELIIQASREDFAPQELDSLADALGDASADPSVSIGIKVQDNSGVLPPEIVHVFLPWLEGYVAGKMVDATLKWLQEMWKRRKRRKRGGLWWQTFTSMKNLSPESSAIGRMANLGVRWRGLAYGCLRRSTALAVRAA